MNKVIRQRGEPGPRVDEDERMLAYARSRECSDKIAAARSEIEAGGGIVADEAYFAGLKERRAKLRRSV